MATEEEITVASHFAVYKMNVRLFCVCFLLTLTYGKDLGKEYRQLPNVIAVVGRSFEYFLPHQDGSERPYKVS